MIKIGSRRLYNVAQAADSPSLAPSASRREREREREILQVLAYHLRNATERAKGLTGCCLQKCEDVRMSMATVHTLEGIVTSNCALAVCPESHQTACTLSCCRSAAPRRIVTCDRKVFEYAARLAARKRVVCCCQQASCPVVA